MPKPVPPKWAQWSNSCHRNRMPMVSSATIPCGVIPLNQDTPTGGHNRIAAVNHLPALPAVTVWARPQMG